jgi:hypothetical protein
MPQMLSLQRHPKVLITMSDLQNPAISPQTLTESLSLCQTAASASRSISNLTPKDEVPQESHSLLRTLYLSLSLSLGFLV